MWMLVVITEVAQRRAGNASLVLASIVVLGIATAWAARWMSRRRDELIAKRDEFLEKPRIAAFRDRFLPQLDFLRRRLDPAHRFGLFLTVSLLVAFVAGWLFLLLLEDVVGTNGVAVVDRAGVRFFAEHRESFLTGAMRAVTMIGGGAVVAGVMALAAVAAFIATRALKLPAFVALAMTGGFVLVRILKPIVGRARPQLDPVYEVADPAFPSGHATWAAVLFATLAILLTRNRGWVPSVWIWAAAVFGAGMVGMSRVYLGVHWPTDVLGGLALGGFWVALSAALVQGIRWDEKGPLRKRLRRPADR